MLPNVWFVRVKKNVRNVKRAMLDVPDVAGLVVVLVETANV